MFWGQIKTLFLLVSLSGLLFLFGYWMGGTTGLTFALIISLVMNFVSYFYADKIVLKMYGARPLDRDKYGYIYEMVDELSHNANIPAPKLFMIPKNMANAFATGRNPKNASVAVTKGIVDLLEEHELRGVLAHELSHVKNRDILIATIAATVAMAISYIATMVRWSFLFGGGRGRNRGNGFAVLLSAIIMPIAAVMIQFAISRSREFLADESGAKISHDPLALASALEKLHYDVKSKNLRPESNAQTSTASLFIVNPFTVKGVIKLFSTHPAVEERIKRLQKMAQEGFNV